MMSFGERFGVMAKIFLKIMVIFMVSAISASRPAQGGVDESLLFPNGLKAVLAPQPGNPVISVSVLIKAGSAAEKDPSEYGLAHLMEHMAFKGTEKRGVGEVSGEIENNGGSINAYTSVNSTVYHLSLPNDKLELGLDVLSDIVFHPAYDPEEYLKEKEVVVEEINKSADTPEHVLWDDFMAAVFPDHPYGHRVLGSAESVRGAGRDTALAFHDRYYRPDNAVVVVTGGFDPVEAKELVAKYYGALEAPEGPLAEQPEAGPDSRPKGPLVLTLTNEMVNVPKVVLGFRCAGGADSSENSRIDLMSSVLSLGRSGRLVDQVKIKKSLATDIGSYPYVLAKDGVFIVELETEPDKILPAMAAALEELQGLASNPPSLEELARSRTMAAKTFVERQESAEALGGLLTQFEIREGDYRLRDAYLARWGRVTPLDLARLAQRVFTADNMVVVIMLPAGVEAPSEVEIVRLAKGLRLEVADDALEAASFENFTLSNGVRVLAMRDATLPLVSVRITSMGGMLYEPQGQEGVANLMTRVWAKATETMDSDAFTRAVEGMGATIDSSSGRNSMTIYGSFMSANWLEGLDFLADAMIKPAFAPDNIEEARQEILAWIKVAEEHLTDRVVKNLRNILFRGHPYQGDTLGKTETVSAITRDDLVAYYNSKIRPDNVVVAIAGDIEPKAAVEALERRLGSWTGAPGAPIPPLPEVPGPLKEPTEIDEAADSAAQVHLAVAFLAPGLGHPDQAPLEVLSGHLNGLGGVMFNELRNKRSLAYSVGAGYNPGLKVGAFTFYIASDNQKTRDALTGMLGIIEDIRTKPIDEAAVAGAIRYVSGNRKIQLQSLESRSDEALFSELYNLGPDFDKRYLEALAAVTAEDVLRVAAKYFDPQTIAVSVVGPQTAVDAVKAVIGGASAPAK